MRIELRNDTAANWTAANPVLAAGEFGCENDTLLFKKGDGATAWNSLPYANAGSLAPTALQFNATAKTNLAAESVAAIDGSGVYNPDLTIPQDVANIVGICATAALAGNEVTVQTIGAFTEALWNWLEGPIYCALEGGQLTQSPPSASPGAVVQVAQAISPTTIQVGVKSAILL